MKKLLAMIVLVVITTGCTNIYTHETGRITPGSKIFVKSFDGPGGGIVSNNIAMELSKNNLLAQTKQEADFILTGDSLIHFGGDETSFSIKDKNGVLVMTGTGTSGGFLGAGAVGRDLGKKIAKKIKNY